MSPQPASLCRFCRAPLTRTFLDLGLQPLANSYLTPEQLAAGNEPVFPLHTKVCDACFLVQADHEVPAEAIFDADYAYFSSFSPGWVEHARRYAEAMTERFGLGPESLVVEIASNDGYLLTNFVAAGIPCLGVEALGGEPWRHEPDPKSLEAKSLAIDASLARAVLGFESRLEAPEAVALTMDWYRRQANGEDALSLCREQIEGYEARR